MNPEEAEFARALRDTPVPDGLRDSLLHSIAQAEGAGRAPVRRWTRWAPLAAAACLVFALAGMWQWNWKPRAEFAQTRDYREAMAHYIANVPFQLDYSSRDLAAIDSWLQSSAGPDVPALPETLAGRLPLGCKEIDWGGVNVSLICFYESEPGARIVHLFVVPRSAVSEDAVDGLEESLLASGFDTRGWKTDDWVCVLVPSKRDMQVSPLLDGAHFVQPV